MFLLLHIFGAHYTYEQVPFGFTLEEWLGSTRNMYDRLVHFAYGFPLVLPLCEIFWKHRELRKEWAYHLSLGTIMAGAALYEIFEWAVIGFVNPTLNLSVTFIGAQGDVWDSQKDMSMALFGALVMVFVIAIVRHWKKSKN